MGFNSAFKGLKCDRKKKKAPIGRGKGGCMKLQHATSLIPTAQT